MMRASPTIDGPAIGSSALHGARYMSLARLTGLAATAVAGVTLTVALIAQGPAAPKTYKFSAAELAAPSEHHQNPAKLVPRPEGATLSLPPGFTATLFASG